MAFGNYNGFAFSAGTGFGSSTNLFSPNYASSSGSRPNIASQPSTSPSEPSSGHSRIATNAAVVDAKTAPLTGPPAKKAKLEPPLIADRKFPLPSRFHGKEFVTVHVGEDDEQIEFVIHKSLLCTASDYFAAAIDGNFTEAHRNILELRDHCPMAFGVLYQYIYTGQVQPSHYYTDCRIESDTLWLRTFQLADVMLLSDLKRIAYEALKDCLGSAIATPPSQTFIDELFDHE